MRECLGSGRLEAAVRERQRLGCGGWTWEMPVGRSSTRPTLALGTCRCEPEHGQKKQNKMCKRTKKEWGGTCRERVSLVGSWPVTGMQYWGQLRAGWHRASHGNRAVLPAPLPTPNPHWDLVVSDPTCLPGRESIDRRGYSANVKLVAPARQHQVVSPKHGVEGRHKSGNQAKTEPYPYVC